MKHNGEAYTQTVPTAAPVLATCGEAVVATSQAVVQSPDVGSMPLYAGNKKNTIIFSPDNTKLSGGKTVTVTLKNKAGGQDYRFTVTPVWMAPANASGQLTSFLVNAGAYTEIRLVTPVPLGVKVTSKAPGVAAFESLDASTGIVTLKGGSAGNSTIKVSSQDDKTVLSYAVTVKSIPSSSYITITNGGIFILFLFLCSISFT